MKFFECIFTNFGRNGYVISIDTEEKLNDIKNCSFNYINEQSSGGIYNINDKLVLIGNFFQQFQRNVYLFFM